MGKIIRDRNSGRTIWLLIFVAVSIFCIIFFAGKGKFTVPVANKTALTLLAPFQRAANFVSSSVRRTKQNIRGVLRVHEENKKLKSEIEQLRAQNVRAKEFAEENIRLRALLEYKNKTRHFDLKPARVIGRDAATWSRVIVIDRGTTDGVQKDMAVVTDRGLVGCVAEAGPVSAKVELITDPRVAVGVLVQRSRVAGVVEGSIQDTAHPRMINLTRNADITGGDLLVTSGFGGIYPKGIIIGHVREVNNDEGGLLKYASIETLVDFDRLEDVAVVIAAREAPLEETILQTSENGGAKKEAGAMR